MINLEYTELLSSNIIFDLTNFLLCSTIVLYLCKLNNIKKAYTIILLLHCLLPFFLNDFIFDINFMPDQVKYAFQTNWYRNFYFDNDINFKFSIADDPINYLRSKIGFYTWFFSLMPLPNSETIRFLGFSNKLLFCLLFLYLLRKKIVNDKTCLVYLFYPSLTLYSGLGLREMSSFFFLVIIITQAYNFKPDIKNITLFLFSIFFLYITISQYLIFIIPILLILLFNIGQYKSKGFSVLQYFIFFVILICVSYYFFSIFKNELNSLKYSFYIETDNDQKNYEEVNSYFDFLYLFCKGIFNLLLPLSYNINSIFKTLQFIENIIVLVLILISTLQCFNKNLKKGLLWLLFLISSLGIISFIVENVGTTSRYKFSIIIIYLIFVNYNNKNEKNKNLSNMCG